MANRVIDLSAESEAFVRARVQNGQYANEASVIDAALEALQRKEAHERKLAALRGLIQEGMSSEVAPDGVFDRVKQRAGLTPKAAA